jgi:hypothetical protein
MAYKIGETVRLIQPVIQGKVIDTEYNKSTESVHHLVSFKNADGEDASRWFDPKELELVESK